MSEIESWLADNYDQLVREGRASYKDVAEYAESHDSHALAGWARKRAKEGVPAGPVSAVEFGTSELAETRPEPQRQTRKPRKPREAKAPIVEKAVEPDPEKVSE